MRFVLNLLIACIIFCSSVAISQEAKRVSAKNECPPPIDLVPPNDEFPQSYTAIKKYAANDVWKVEIPAKTEGGRAAPNLSD
jgi:hypothetical protein